MKHLNARRRKSGFTLIEILVVVVILAILAAVVVPNVIHKIGEGRISAAISDISSFKTALQLYSVDTGQFPTQDQGLNALVQNPGVPGWTKTYLQDTEKIQLDPWGNQYVYKNPSEHGQDYDIISAGPDGQLGTADDIQSWNLKKQ
jgi:general secretion pathway protein G